MSGRTINFWRKARVSYRLAPDAPEAPTASNIGANGVTLSWPAVAEADSFRLQQSPAGDDAWVDVFSGFAQSTVVSGLTAATDYDFQLAALNGAAQSLWSPVTTVTTAGSTAPPATPGTPVASNVTETTATLTVAAVPTATSYGWQRSATGPTTGFAAVAGTGESISNGGMTAATDYWFRVRASNADGDSAYSTAVAVTTDTAPVVAPTKPAKLILASQTTTSNTLQITPVAGATSYQTQRSVTAPGVQPWTNVQIGPELTVTDAGRAPGAVYYYRHSASNTAGESPQSDTLTVNQPTSTVTVQPYSALTLRTSSGVAIHALNNPWIEYGNIDAVFDAVERLNVTWIRGLAVPGNNISDQYAAQCVARGLKWCMATSATESSPTIVQAENKVRAIAANPNYASVCLALEGLNEPNNGAPVPTGYGGDWAEWAADMQRVIKQTAVTLPALNGVQFVGTSLHQLAAKNSGGEHYVRLKNAGILNYQDVAGIHAYPNGRRPMHNMDMRFDMIYDAYGADYPMRMTEFGYTTLATIPSGTSNATTKQAMGVYGPRAYLQLCLGEGIPMSWYELLDDEDATGNDIQSHYGMVETPSGTNPATWTDKPVVASVAQLLNWAEEPAGTAAYTPARVVANVTTTFADVKWFVVARKDQSDQGTASVFIFRDLDVASGGTNLTVNPVNVTISDRLGARPFQVNANVQRVDLR